MSASPQEVKRGVDFSMLYFANLQKSPLLITSRRGLVDISGLG